MASASSGANNLVDEFEESFQVNIYKNEISIEFDHKMMNFVCLFVIN